MKTRLSLPQVASALTLAIALLLPSVARTEAGPRSPPAAFIDCTAPELTRFEIAGLASALRDAGGRGCRVVMLPWGTRVECDTTAGLAVAGIPVRSLSAEVTDGGVRRVVTVTAARVGRLAAALTATEPAPGVERAIEAREDGASLVRCTAPGNAGDAGLGAMAGTLPAPIEGSLGWLVCAVAAFSAAQRCIEVASEAGWRIDGLAPGAWRVRADPIGGSRSACALAAERVPDLAGPVPVLAMRPLEVRAGSTTQAGELRISYGTACRR